MNKPSSHARIERKSSIDSEPRTLSLQQLQHAREAAVYILNTKPFEEAIGIFTEGLRPVLRLGHDGSTAFQLEEASEDADHVAGPARWGESGLLPTSVKDIVSAPF